MIEILALAAGFAPGLTLMLVIINDMARLPPHGYAARSEA